MPRMIFRWTGKDQQFKSQACLKIHWLQLSITIGRDEKRSKMDVDSINSVDGRRQASTIDQVENYSLVYVFGYIFLGRQQAALFITPLIFKF